MQVKIKALDTFHDSRVHVGGAGGSLHRGQVGTASDDAAKDLEKLGLVMILSDNSIPQDEAEREKAERLKAEAKLMPSPNNKMLNKRKTK